MSLSSHRICVVLFVAMFCIPMVVDAQVSPLPPSMKPNVQSGTTYTVLSGDRSKLVTFSNASPVSVTLPQAGTSFPNGWHVDVQNRGAGTVTITPSTSTIDGAASIDLTTGQGIRIASNGTNYYTQRGRGSASSGYATIQDEASNLTQRPTVNFTGAGVSCVDNAGATRTDCTITGSGGGLTHPEVLARTSIGF